MYGNPVAPSEVELTFNPSFYPSLVRMPMARYRRNIWKSGGSRLSVCPWRDIGEIYGNPVAPSEVELTFNPSFYPSLVRMPMAEDLPPLPTVAGQL